MANSRSIVRNLLIVLFLAGLIAGSLTASILSAQAAPHQAGIPDSVVISQFRTRGPNGLTDDFVELYNRTTLAVNIGGWILKASNPSGGTSTLYTFDPSVLLESGQYFLVAGSGYSGGVPADKFFTNAASIADDGGVALIDPSAPTVPIDEVGMSTTSAYNEPADGSKILAPLTGLPSPNQSYQRKPGGVLDSYIDTNSNSDDFILISPSVPRNSNTPLSLQGTPLPTLTPTLTPTSTSTRTSTPTPTPTNTPNVSCELTPPPTVYGPQALVINEVGWSGTLANTSDQWVEIYNPGPCPINLSGWYLQGVISSSQQFKIDLHNDADPVGDSIGGGQYFVLATSSSVFQTNVVINQPSSSLNLLKTFSTPGETLFLVGSHSELVDHANFTGGAWPAGLSSTRASMERIRANAPDVRDSWVTYAGPTTNIKDASGNFVRGTPGRQNWAYDVTITPSPFKTATKKPTQRPPTPFAHMVINEFLPRPGFDWNNDGAINTEDEFIEIKNNGPISINLSGWQLDNVTAEGSHLYHLPSLLLTAGQRVLYFGSVSGIPLLDSGGTVRLINNRGIVVDARGYDPVKFPDQSTCRLPDGDYWTFPCFPTPGLENARTGTLPVAALPANPNAPIPPTPTVPCQVADTMPDVFRLALCAPFGADIWNGGYWNNQAGNGEVPVQDILDKWLTVLQ